MVPLINQSDVGDDEADQVARLMASRSHPEVALSLRSAVPDIIAAWRRRSRAAFVDLDALSIAEFEDSIAVILMAVAGAMENLDPASIRRVLAEAPAHGMARSVQQISPHIMLSELRILRAVVIVELRERLGRPLAADEASSLHELLDVMMECSIIALMDQRGGEREKSFQSRIGGLHRLADLGTLVAGVAHDASNLLLPLWMNLEHFEASELSPEARVSLGTVKQIIRQFQNSIVNLRWLSMDSQHGHAIDASLDLLEWSRDVTSFYSAILPREVEFCCVIPEGTPRVRMSSAALSQVVFNLVRNAQRAILAGGGGSIRIRAREAVLRGADGVMRLSGVEVSVEDDGPGMSAEVLRRCREPFFTTFDGGSGLGLALVQSLVAGVGRRR